MELLINMESKPRTQTLHSLQALIFNLAIANLDIFYFISLRDMPFSIMARKRCNPAQNTTLVVWLSQKLRCWVGQRILTQTKFVFNIGIFLFLILMLLLELY